MVKLLSTAAYLALDWFFTQPVQAGLKKDVGACRDVTVQAAL